MHEGDRGQWRAVDQRAQVAQRRPRDTRARVVRELLTGQRIQHPGRDRHVHVVRERNDHAVGRVAPPPTDDRYVFAVERMVTVVNRG